MSNEPDGLTTIRIEDPIDCSACRRRGLTLEDLARHRICCLGTSICPEGEREYYVVILLDSDDCEGVIP